MTTPLCNRCELLFQECRPLAGVLCPLTDVPDPPHLGRAVPAAAIVVDRITCEARAVPLQAVDFYRGNP